MKFLVPNYSCLQNPWLQGYRPEIPVLSVLCPQLNLLTTPNKIPGYATAPLILNLNTRYRWVVSLTWYIIVLSPWTYYKLLLNKHQHSTDSKSNSGHISSLHSCTCFGSAGPSSGRKINSSGSCQRYKTVTLVHVIYCGKRVLLCQ
jgi:hypothetical protein